MYDKTRRDSLKVYRLCFSKKKYIEVEKQCWRFYNWKSKKTGVNLDT